MAPCSPSPRHSRRVRRRPCVRSMRRRLEPGWRFLCGAGCLPLLLSFCRSLLCCPFRLPRAMPLQRFNELRKYTAQPRVDLPRKLGFQIRLGHPQLVGGPHSRHMGSHHLHYEHSFDRTARLKLFYARQHENEQLIVLNPVPPSERRQLPQQVHAKMLTEPEFVDQTRVQIFLAIDASLGSGSTSARSGCFTPRQVLRCILGCCSLRGRSCRLRAPVLALLMLGPRSALLDSRSVQRLPQPSVVRLRSLWPIPATACPHSLLLCDSTSGQYRKYYNTF